MAVAADIAEAKGCPEGEFYQTPTACTEALLRRELFHPRIWEPACGGGAIATTLERAGHDVTSTDLLDWGYGDAGRDFLAERSLLAPSIVTNPPFSLAEQFVAHALDLGAAKVALFLRLSFLEGAARHRGLWVRSPASRVWVFSKRQTLWRGDRKAPAKGGSGTVAYAWFIWEAGHTGPVVGWI